MTGEKWDQAPPAANEMASVDGRILRRWRWAVLISTFLALTAHLAPLAYFPNFVGFDTVYYPEPGAALMARMSVYGGLGVLALTTLAPSRAVAAAGLAYPLVLGALLAYGGGEKTVLEHIPHQFTEYPAWRK